MSFKLLSRLKEDIVNIDSDIYEDIYYDKNSNNKVFNLYNEILKSIDEKRFLNKIILKEALEEDSISTIKLLFYTRDIEYGLGKRELFKDAIKYIGLNYSNNIEGYISSIPKYGRWDDLYSLFDTPCESKVIDIFKNQIKKDIKSNSPSNLGKWLKSINTSSKKSRELAIKTAKDLNMSYKEYRKLLTLLRTKIGIVEQKISNNEWENIKYGEVPALAYKKYTKAFIKNDFSRFIEYENMNKANKSIYIKHDGKRHKKLTLKDHVKSLMQVKNRREESSIYEKELVEFIQSISSHPRKIITALSISKNNALSGNTLFIESLCFTLFYLYNNTGLFNNYIIKTNENYSFKKIDIHNICIIDALEEIIKNSISNYINVESILDLILFAAIKNKMNNEDIIDEVLIIVDDIKKIQYTNICSNDEKVHFEYNKYQRKWDLAGYKLPKIKILELNTNKNLDLRDVNENFKIISGYRENIFEIITKDRLDLINLDRDNLDRYNTKNNKLESILQNKRYEFEI